MPFVGVFFKLLKAILSEAGAWPIAWGFGLGMLLGLTPFWAHSLFFLLLALFFRVNFASVLGGWALFGLISIPAGAAMAGLGEAWLTHPGWQSIWSAAYQSRALQLLHFHHTLTLGSLAVALVLFLPVVFGTYKGVPPLRRRLLPIAERFHLRRVGKANSWYGRLAGLWQRFV